MRDWCAEKTRMYADAEDACPCAGTYALTVEVGEIHYGSAATLAEEIRRMAVEGDYFVPSASHMSAFIGYLLLDRPATTVLVPAHAAEYFANHRKWSHNVVFG